MSKYKILSLDGGGLRGLITARLIDRLNSHPEIKGWLDSVDLFAGTSTGGILALGLSIGKSPNEISDLYRIKGKEIFDDSFLDNILDLSRFVGAEYSSKNLKAELKKIFGNKKLGNISKKVVIPTFDLDNEASTENRTWKPKIFHNFLGHDSDKDALLSNVALYTSSAPTYFPSADGYIDGGVYANNPSIISIAQAISKRNDPSEKIKLDDIVLLSIGSGVSLKYITGATLDWGYAQWAKPLIDVLMDGVAGISDYQAQQLLDNRYHRLQITFDANERIELDAVDQISRMDEIATESLIDDTVKWIKESWL